MKINWHKHKEGKHNIIKLMWVSVYYVAIAQLTQGHVTLHEEFHSSEWSYPHEVDDEQVDIDR